MIYFFYVNVEITIRAVRFAAAQIFQENNNINESKGMVKMLEFKLYIGGRFIGAKSGRMEESKNPADGSVFAKYAVGDEADVDAAITAAQEAFPGWKSKTAPEREEYLLKMCDHLVANHEKYAGWLIDDSGSCFMKAMDEVGQCVNIIRAAAGECRRIDGGIVPADSPNQISAYVRSPLGVIGGIGPFNYPLLLTIEKAVLAMAAGNTFVLKSSSSVPSAGAIIAECVDAAGLPGGVFNVVNCPSDVGDLIVRDPRVKLVTFTGSTGVGKKIAVACAEGLKRVVLEMGGKSPAIILKDFDVDRAVSITAFGVYFHQGQICMATGRIVAEAPIYDEFCEKMTAKAKRQKVGNPREKDSIIGPLIKRSQCDFIDELIKDAVEKGARLLTGGTHEDSYYAPTVVADVTPEMRLFYEETFGPVATIVKAKDADDALRLANDNIYGLSSAVYTNDLTLAMKLADGIEAGMVHINAPTVMGARRAPFGGVKDSGMGREGSKFSIDEFTELKWVTIDLVPGGFPTDM